MRTASESWRRLYPFDSHHLSVPGGRLHYVDTRPGAAEGVLLLHGNPTWSFLYRGLVRTLGTARRCVAPDHLGCGLSDKPARYAYTLENHIANAAAVVEACGLRRFDLVVHDWGGAIGLGLARLMPERVGRLVVSNSAAFFLPGLDWRIALCRHPVSGPWLVRGLNAFVWGVTHRAVQRPLSREVRQGYAHPYRNWADRVALWNFIRDIPVETDHPSRKTLDAIDRFLPALRSHPMLLAWGMRDWCFHPGFLREWQKRFPAAQVREFQQAGHLVMEDVCDDWVTIVKDFLRNV